MSKSVSESLIRRWNRLTLGRGARVLALVGLAGASAWIAHAQADRPLLIPGTVILGPPPKAQRIEAAFVLDTTGSMSGLIDGAKQKIWAIANQMASASGAPEIRLGLIGYRDRGDDYVTALHDLSDDIDALYGRLQTFHADGGGDGPESVNQALHEAVTRLSWSDDPSAYRVIFLVGDAPPHMDYAQDVAYARSVEMARAKGIVINTIQCGLDPETTRVWREIASLNQGSYAAIAQDGAMVASTAPQDAELAELNRLLLDNAIAYGSREEQDELGRKLESARGAAPESAAARLSYLDKKGGALNSGRADLVDAVTSGSVALSSVPPASLPAPMQAMSEPEREKYVADKAEERKQLRARIGKLAKDRDAHLAAESAKPGKADSFDAQVFGAIREQAAEKGIAY
jgi:hypothetical protein